MSADPVSLDEMERPTLWADMRAELKWTWTGRKGWLVGIGINLVIGLLYVGSTHYDPAKTDDISTANGVAAGLVLWVLSDPVNTNQLGPEADRVVELLRDRFGVARTLFLKNAALATLLIPLSMVLSSVLRVMLNDDRSIPTAILLDVWIVLGWLALGNLASIWAPYRTMSLKRRWRMKATWPWWFFCQLLPYGIYFTRAHTIEPVAGIVSRALSGGEARQDDVTLCFLFAATGVVLLLISYAICGLYGHLRPAQLERALLRDR